MMLLDDLGLVVVIHLASVHHALGFVSDIKLSKAMENSSINDCKYYITLTAIQEHTTMAAAAADKSKAYFTLASLDSTPSTLVSAATNSRTSSTVSE